MENRDNPLLSTDLNQGVTHFHRNMGAILADIDSLNVHPFPDCLILDSLGELGGDLRGNQCPDIHREKFFPTIAQHPAAGIIDVQYLPPDSLYEDAVFNLIDNLNALIAASAQFIHQSATLCQLLP